MTESMQEPDLALELEEMRQRNRAAVIRFIAAHQKFREMREGKSDLPVYPVEDVPCR